ncbi:MAG: DUF2232 domain-containing protein [Bdellovibrionota bacterium]
MKNAKVTPQKFLYLSSLSILLTMLTLVFGTPFLRAIKRSYGALAFWVLGLLLSIVFWQLKAHLLLVFVNALWISLGIQMECEKRGFRWWLSSFLGLSIGAFVGFAGAALLLRSFGLASEESLVGLLEEFLASLQQTSQVQLKLSAKDFLQIVPGLFIVILELALGMGLIFERKVFRWFQLPYERFVSQVSLLEYKLPDGLIWATLSALLLAFVSFGSTTANVIGLNFVYIAGTLYFFQGLAIIEVFLMALKVGFFGRFLVYFLMVGQLLPVVALFGFIDFWIDFRKRIRTALMKSKKTQPNGND